MQHDTQYKVLQELCGQLTGESIEEGHHTATLKHEFESCLDSTAVTIVLDEADFLLVNDGNDLLYYLSRVSAANPVSTISISANHPELASHVDTRTYSSLQPHHITFEGYSEDQAHQILHTHTEQFDDTAPPVYPQAIERIATTTTNIRFGMHWLRYAIQETESAVTNDEVN
jgi:cell division control protein 6